MLFTCLKENLALGVSTVGHIALKGNSLPVLTNILLQVDEQGLQLTTTNLEVGIRHTVRGKVEKPGDCLVSAKLLTELLPLLPDGQIRIALTPEGVLISSGKTASTLRTTQSADFPIIPTVDEKNSSFTFPRETLRRLFEATHFAASRGDQRPQFKGVYIKTNEGTFTAAATDGFRLAEATTTVAETTLPSVQTIIPLPATQEVLRILGLSSEEAVQLVVSENQAQLSFGATEITTRLVEGTFPDYETLFPSGGATYHTDGSTLARAVKATALFSRAGVADITFAPGEKGTSLVVYSENSELGSHRTEVATTITGDPPATVVLNARFLLDGLAVISGMVAVVVKGSDQPLLLLPKTQGAIPWRYLIMPIRE